MRTGEVMMKGDGGTGREAHELRGSGAERLRSQDEEPNHAGEGTGSCFLGIAREYQVTTYVRV
mgnify:CR=1 FL=1|jgi:hypothetical protein